MLAHSNLGATSFGGEDPGVRVSMWQGPWGGALMLLGYLHLNQGERSRPVLFPTEI